MEWDAPESDGGGPIAGYSIDTCPAGNSQYLRAGKSRPDNLKFEVTGLKPQAKYNVRVWAENAAGASECAGELDTPAETKPSHSKFTIPLLD